MIQYNRIYNSSSYSLLRTNPLLSTNVKLVYDIEADDVYMQAYNVSKELSDNKYKYYHINAENSFYNEDVHRFWNQGKTLVSKEIAFKPTHVSSDSEFISNASLQFERTYAVNASYGNGKILITAPIYLKKQLPEQIVVFKMRGPSVYSYDSEKTLSTADIIKSAEIVTTVDISSNTKLGQYIRRYVNQEEFYDAPYFLNKNNLTLRGIDYNSGILTSVVKDISDIIRYDTCLNVENWKISSLLYENSMIEMNVMNLSVLFDDDLEDDFSVNRYFVMYSNNIELLQLKYNCVYNKRYGNYTYAKYTKDTVVSKGNCLTGINPTIEFSDIKYLNDYDKDSNLFVSKEFMTNVGFYTLKDKYGKLHGINVPAYRTGYQIDRLFECTEDTIDVSIFTGMEEKSVQMRYVRQDGYGNDAFTFIVDKSVVFQGDVSLTVYDTLFNSEESEYVNSIIKDFTSVEDFISLVNNSDSYIKAYSYTDDDKIYVCVRNVNEGHYDKIINVLSEDFIHQITLLNVSSEYRKEFNGYMIESIGGTDTEGTILMVPVKYLPMFTDGIQRYIKVNNNYAKILSVCRNIFNKDNSNIKRDYYSTYNESFTDKSELRDYCFILIDIPVTAESGTIKVYKEFSPTVGILSFMPVRDIFSYNDYILSEICSDTSLKEEVSNIDKDIFTNHIDSISVVSKDTFDSEREYQFNCVQGIYMQDEPVSIEDSGEYYSVTFHTADNKESGSSVDDTIYEIAAGKSYAEIHSVIGYLGIYNIPEGKKIPLYLNTIDATNSAYVNQLFDVNNKGLDSEYNYYSENDIPSLANVNKTKKYINLFCYRTQGIDSLTFKMNLNFSKIFRNSNLCSNPYVKEDSILDYTHDVGYYLNNYYSHNNTQGKLYVDASKYYTDKKWKDFTVEDWLNEFTSKTDIYYYLFESENPYYIDSKFFSEIYTVTDHSESFFKGIKFCISEAYIDGVGKNHTGYFNDWKITILDIPVFNVNEEDDYDTVRCIVNKNTKYILFLRFFEVIQLSEESEESEYNIDEYKFTRSLVYILSMKSAAYSKYKSKNMFTFVNAINSDLYDYILVGYDLEDSEMLQIIPNIYIEYPQKYITDDFLVPVEVVETTYKDVKRYADVEQSNCAVQTLYRYNGEYELQAKDIILFTSSYNTIVNNAAPNSNTFINFCYDKNDTFNVPFVINEYYHKYVNSDAIKSNDTYQISNKQTNIFFDNLVFDYFVRTTNLVNNTYEVYENLSSPVSAESNALYGTRIVKLPSELHIDAMYEGSKDITGQDVNYVYSNVDKDILYSETDDTITIYLMMNNILTYTILNSTELYKNFIEKLGIDEINGYNFLENYIRNNIIRKYSISEILVYTNQSVSDKQNDYINGIKVSDEEKEALNYKKIENPIISDTTDTMIKKITLKKEKNMSYSVSFSVTVKR